MLRNKLYNQLVNVSNYINDLKSIKFYNDASNLAIRNYLAFFSFLIDNFDLIEESSFQTIYLRINQNIIPNLRYIERSSTNNIPWSLISNLDKILKQEFGDDYFLLYRPQWRFNYSVLTNDLNNTFKKYLKTLIPSKSDEIELLFGNSNIHIFSFPYLEKSNVLLNSIIGHEIGHFYHNRWINTEEAITIINSQNSELKKHYKLIYPEDIFQPYQKADEGTKILKGMYREILSDIYGYFIFGPSMIFSLYYISSLEGPMKLPSNETNYYPLTKYRIRILFDHLLNSDKTIDKFRTNNSEFSTNLFKYLTEIRESLDNKDDLEKLTDIQKEIELFESTVPQIINYFNKHIKYERFNPIFSAEMFTKLNNYIPINEIDNQPIDIANIIFVGWIYHYKLDTTNRDNEYSKYNRILMKLLMKSLFSTYVHQEYNNQQDRK